MTKNLYKVEYRLVTNDYDAYAIETERKALPTHVVSIIDNAAIETALKYQTINWQLERCFLQESDVIVVNEEL